MGISCEACGIVHLVTATVNRRIDHLRQAGSEMFILTCAGCRTKRSFDESDLTPYSVSTLGYIKGYVERGNTMRGGTLYRFGANGTADDGPQCPKGCRLLARAGVGTGRSVLDRFGQNGHVRL
jgi:hypothetical protein